MKQNNHSYLFDSQSRDETGLSIVDGTSVLIKFSDLREVEKYIQVFYLEYERLEQSWFQLQFMDVPTDGVLSSVILCSHQISRRRMNSRLHTRCIHKRRLRNDTSESSSVEESVKSKKKKITTLTTMKKTTQERILLQEVSRCYLNSKVK